MNEWKIGHIEYEIEISEKSLKFTISIVHTTSTQIAKAKKRNQYTKIGREKNENEKIDLPTARTPHTHVPLAH